MSGLVFKGNSLSNTGEYLPSVYIDKVYLQDYGISVDASVFIPHGEVTLEDQNSNSVEDEVEYIQAVDERVHHYVAVIVGLSSEDHVFESGESARVYYSGQNLYEQIINNDLNPWEVLAYYGESVDNLMQSNTFTGRSTHVVIYEINPYPPADSIVGENDVSLIVHDNNGQEYLKYMDSGTVKVELNTESKSWDWGLVNSLQVIAFSSTVESDQDWEDVVADLSNPVLLDKKVGDISYETVWENGTLADRFQVEYVDATGAIYDQIPLQSIDTFFYKINRITHLEIIDSVKSLLDEYRAAYRLGDLAVNKHAALRNAIDSISVVVQERGEKEDIIPQLNAVRSLFVDKSLSMPVGKFYKQLRQRIFNIDKLIRLSERVRKKVVYNGKIVDERVVRVAVGVSGSFKEGQESCDFIYADWITTTSYLHDWTGVDPDWYRIVSNGYYFFDYEKSLRSDSILSHYVNINMLEAAGVHVPYSHYRVDNSAVNREYSKDWYGMYTQVHVDVTMRAAMNEDLFYPLTEKMRVRDTGDSDANTVNPNNAGSPYTDALSCTLLEGTWSHLMNRRFVDISVDSIDKLSGIDGYRMMCFEMIDFMTPTSGFELSGKLAERYYTTTVNLQDKTMLFFAEIENMINYYIGIYEAYLTRCTQLCSANNTTKLFNAFFSESIMQEYEDNMLNAPWIRCPLFLLSFQNFITGQWGERQTILERAAIITSQINPVNGNLTAVEGFYDDIKEIQDLLSEIKAQAKIDGNYNPMADMFSFVEWYEVDSSKKYTCELYLKDNSEFNDGNGVYPLETSDCDEVRAVSFTGTPDDPEGDVGDTLEDPYVDPDPVDIDELLEPQEREEPL